MRMCFLRFNRVLSSALVALLFSMVGHSEMMAQSRVFDPVLTITPEVINETMEEDGTTTVDITMNYGGGYYVREWQGWIDFGAGGSGSQSAELYYHSNDVNNITGVGSSSSAYTREMAMRLPVNAYADVALGMKISSVSFYIHPYYNSSDGHYTFRLYGPGFSGQPGEVLAEKTLTSSDYGTWITATFDEDVYLSGQTVWASVELLQDVYEYPMTMDVFDYGQNANGNWLRTNGGYFNHCYSEGSYGGSWLITVNCEGKQIPGSWASLSESVGYLMGGQSTNLVLTLNTLGLQYGIYNANLLIKANDENMCHGEIPITLRFGPEPDETPVETEQKLALRDGWNWISSYVDYRPESLAELQEAIASECEAAVIKSQDDGFVNYALGEWEGSLTTMDNAQMYLVKVDHNIPFVFTGSRQDPVSHPITLKPGWNWIGYPEGTPLELSKALSDLQPEEGDLIKGNSGFSAYEALEGKWQGNLTTLEPGKGYVFLSSADETRSFTFPSPPSVVEGIIDIPEGMAASNIEVNNYAEEVVPDANGVFEIGYSKMLTAFNKTNHEVIYMTVVSTDYEGSSGGGAFQAHELNAKETALYYALAMIPFGLSQAKDATLNSIKAVLYDLDAVKALENAIEQSVDQNGYLRPEDIGDEINQLWDFLSEELFAPFQERRSRNAGGDMGRIVLRKDENNRPLQPVIEPNNGRLSGIRLDIEDASFDESANTWTLNMTGYSDNGVYIGMQKGSVIDGYAYAAEGITPYFIPPMNLSKFMGTFTSFSGLKDYFVDTWRLIFEDGFWFDDMTWDMAKLPNIRFELNSYEDALIMLSPKDDIPTVVVNCLFLVMNSVGIILGDLLTAQGNGVFLESLLTDQELCAAFAGFMVSPEGFKTAALSLLSWTIDFFSTAAYRRYINPKYNLDKILDKLVASVPRVLVEVVGDALMMTASWWCYESFAFTVDAEYNDNGGGNGGGENGGEGSLNGAFTVDEHGGQVLFSQGNLQYQASTNTWRFSDHQWDFVGGSPMSGNSSGNVSGSSNNDLSATYSGWIDLFGWATSGYNHGANCYQPWSKSTTTGDYLAYGSDTSNLFDETGQADWGYNAISNGGNQENCGWRTMTQSEWNYVFNTRSTSSGIRFAKARVNNTNGVILLPDDWQTSYFDLDQTNNSNASYTKNVITADEWTALEQHGAVFLPAGGRRQNKYLSDGNYNGNYWSASCKDNKKAYCFSFSSTGLGGGGSAYRYYGFSVRLIKFKVNSTVFSYPISMLSITSNSATFDGYAGGGDSHVVVSRGFCYSTTPNVYLNSPDVTVVSCGSGNGGFSYTVLGLMPETTYYMKAYMITEDGVKHYGEEVSFTTRYAAPVGGIAGKFTINESGDQVFFSQGNLQYQASTNTWRFAENQWDYVGEANSNISPTYTGWIDLFGWGTSGYNHGANCYQPWSTSADYNDYYVYGDNGSLGCDLSFGTGLADWGCNAISNGGNQENSGWRTLAWTQWRYLLDQRNTASGIRFVKAIVNGINGVILLPDDWNSIYYPFEHANATWTAGFSSNVISDSQWSLIERFGAVFLPAGGCRQGTSISDVGIVGRYWTESHELSPFSYIFGFSEGDLQLNVAVNYYGCAVRLARPVQY